MSGNRYSEPWIDPALEAQALTVERLSSWVARVVRESETGEVPPRILGFLERELPPNLRDDVLSMAGRKGEKLARSNPQSTAK